MDKENGKHESNESENPADKARSLKDQLMHKTRGKFGKNNYNIIVLEETKRMYDSI